MAGGNDCVHRTLKMIVETRLCAWWHSGSTIGAAVPNLPKSSRSMNSAIYVPLSHDRSHHHRLIRTNVCGQRVNLVDPSSVSHRPHNHNHSQGLLNYRMPTASVCPPTLGKIDAKNWVPFEKSKCQHRNLPTWHLINVTLPCKSSLIFSQKFLLT